MIMIYGWSTSPPLKRRAVHIGVEHAAQKSNLLVDRTGVTRRDPGWRTFGAAARRAVARLVILG
jgi:hypothetical protein